MTCKRIAKLLSERQDHELSFGRRLAIRLHLTWCMFCRRLDRQLDFIHGLSRAIGTSAEIGDDRAFEATLSAEAKTRIKKTLARKNS